MNTMRFENDIKNAFISEDGRVLRMPVPIGSFVYEVNMTCDRVCENQKDAFKKSGIRKPTYNCNKALDLDCGSRFISIDRIKVTIDNIGKILRRYEITIFDDKEKAQVAGKELMHTRIEKMRACGFDIEDDGMALNSKCRNMKLRY